MLRAADRRGPGEADDAGGGGRAAQPDRSGQGQLQRRPPARHRHLPQQVQVNSRVFHRKFELRVAVVFRVKCALSRQTESEYNCVVRVCGLQVFC